MLPLLKFSSDQKGHHVREMIDYLAGEFQLSAEEKRRLLPSGNDIIFDNKVKWSRLYIGKAGLLESTKTGYWKITKRGLQVLSQNPPKIDVKFLEQFPEYREWRKTTSRETKGETTGKVKVVEEKTPEEDVEYGCQQMRNELVQRLLIRIKNASPKFFETLVVELLVKMGYGGSKKDAKDAGAVVGGSGDEGIDGVIKQDRLGLDVIYIQAKRWENTTVSGSELQKFVGALEEKRANKGVFITTSNFTKSANECVEKIGKQVVLIDGEELAKLMIDYDIGVSRVKAYEIKRLDSDYFTEE
jgi:restriction system protein